MSARHRPRAEGENAAGFVPGASGYVGGGLLRRTAVHPRLDLAAAVSGSPAGEPIGAHFPSRVRGFAGRPCREAAARFGKLREAAGGDSGRFGAGASAVVPRRRPEPPGAVRAGGEHRSGGGRA